MKYDKDLAKKLLNGELTSTIEEYYNNKRLNPGDRAFCPNCGSLFYKKNKQHAFCHTKCKDVFWNDMVEERFKRKIEWNRGRYEN